jgi:hypothetical protein
MPNRYLSSMLIDYQSRKILIDCGEGTQVSMRENKTGFKTLDIICLTHFHGDHIYGLPGLLSTMGNSGRTESLTIIGPSGVNEIIQALRQTIPYLPFGVDIIENPQAPLSLYPDPASGGLKLNHGSAEAKGKVEIILSTLKLHHSSPCLGYSLYIPRRPRFYPDRAIQQGIPVRYWKRLQQVKGGYINMTKFNGLGMNMGNLWRLSDAKTRSISPENFDGAKGKGGMATLEEGSARWAARELGQGWKVNPYIIIQPGEIFTIADIEGPGAIQHIWMTPTGNWRNTIMRIYWDGLEYPSVECPVGDFFACGWGEYAQVSSLAVCVNPGSAFNCYWEMPFKKHAKITMENRDDEPMTLYHHLQVLSHQLYPPSSAFQIYSDRIRLPRQIYPVFDPW